MNSSVRAANDKNSAVPKSDSSLRDFIVKLWPIDGACSEMHIGDVYFTLYFVTAKS